MQLLGRITAKEQTKEPRERCVELARVIFLYRALFDCGCWLLAAVDTFPRGGLCSGYYAVCAALRYLQVWRPSLVHLNQQDALPPLDVAWAWLVARQQPIPYRALGSGNGPYATAFLFGVTSDRDRRCWAEAVAKAAAAVAADAEGVGSRAGLAGQAAWPPPLPVPGEQPWAGIGAELLQEAVELAEDMQRFSTLLRSWLRPQFLDTDFLVRAQFRYSQFLELHALNPHTVLVPTADIALMWHTHIGLHGEYARSCGELFPAPAAAPATITTTTTTTTTTMASATASAASDHAAASQTPLPDSGTGGQCQGGEGSHSEGRHSAGSHGEGSHKVGYLFSPDYLRLRGIQLEAAFAETARLYEEQYGEPYLSPDVAWIPPGEVYPAADPAGPLSALLDVFNAMPAAASDASATHLAQQVPSTRLQWHAAATPRAGGHALFTLWLIARTLAEGPPFPRLSVRVGQAEVRVGQVAGAAEADAAAATCCGCFGAPRRALPAERVLGLASVAQTGGSEAVGDVSAPKLSVLSDLFALAIGERIGLLYHMRLLPAWTEHPFLACIRERPGLWVPPRTVVVSPSKTSVDSTKRDGSRSAAVVVATANDSQPGGVGTTPAAPDRLVLRKEVQFEAADSEPDSPPPAGGTAPLSPPPPPQDATLNRVWEPAPSACQGGRYAVTDCERFMDSTAPLGPQLAGLAEALGGPLSVEALPSSQSGRELVAGSRRLLGRRSETASRRPRSSSMRRARDAGGGSGSSTTDAGEATRPIQDLLRKPQWLVEVRRVVRGRAEEPFDPHARGLRYTPGSATLTEGAGLGLELPVNRSRDADGAVGAGGAETARDRVADRRAVRSIADVYDLEVELQLVSAVAVVLPAAVDTSGGRRSP